MADNKLPSLDSFEFGLPDEADAGYDPLGRTAPPPPDAQLTGPQVPQSGSSWDRFKEGFFSRSFDESIDRPQLSELPITHQIGAVHRRNSPSDLADWAEKAGYEYLGDTRFRDPNTGHEYDATGYSYKDAINVGSMSVPVAWPYRAVPAGAGIIRRGIEGAGRMVQAGAENAAIETVQEIPELAVEGEMGDPNAPLRGAAFGAGVRGAIEIPAGLANATGRGILRAKSATHSYDAELRAARAQQAEAETDALATNRDATVKVVDKALAKRDAAIKALEGDIDAAAGAQESAVQEVLFDKAAMHKVYTDLGIDPYTQKSVVAGTEKQLRASTERLKKVYYDTVADWQTEMGIRADSLYASSLDEPVVWDLTEELGNLPIADKRITKLVAAARRSQAVQFKPHLDQIAKTQGYDKFNEIGDDAVRASVLDIAKRTSKNQGIAMEETIGDLLRQRKVLIDVTRKASVDGDKRAASMLVDRIDESLASIRGLKGVEYSKFRQELVQRRNLLNKDIAKEVDKAASPQAVANHMFLYGAEKDPALALTIINRTKARDPRQLKLLRGVMVEKLLQAETPKEAYEVFSKFHPSVRKAMFGNSILSKADTWISVPVKLAQDAKAIESYFKTPAARKQFLDAFNKAVNMPEVLKNKALIEQGMKALDQVPDPLTTAATAIRQSGLPSPAAAAAAARASINPTEQASEAAMRAGLERSWRDHWTALHVGGVLAGSVLHGQVPHLSHYLMSEFMAMSSREGLRHFLTSNPKLADAYVRYIARRAANTPVAMGTKWGHFMSHVVTRKLLEAQDGGDSDMGREAPTVSQEFMDSLEMPNLSPEAQAIQDGQVKDISQRLRQGGIATNDLKGILEDSSKSATQRKFESIDNIYQKMAVFGSMTPDEKAEVAEVMGNAFNKAIQSSDMEEQQALSRQWEVINGGSGEAQ